MRENTRVSSGFLVLPVAMVLVILGMGLVIASIGDAQTASRVGVLPTIVPPTSAVIPTEVAAAPTAVSDAVAASGVINFDTRVVQTGRSLFQTTCSACHASNARGIPGIGKNLIDSAFVRGMTDDELLQFIVVGRAASDPLNTTGIIMPARGANPAMSDAQIHDVIVYLRSEAQTEFGTAYLEGVDMSVAASVALQAEAAPAPTLNPDFVLPITLLGLDKTPEAVEAAPTEDPNFVLPITALGLDNTDPDATAEAAATAEAPAADSATARIYNQVCAGCHGLQGEGVENVGTPLVGDPTASDPDLVFTYMTTVQMPDPARNGFAHPSRYAFPDLATDAALRALAAYTAALAGG